jgi:hypothetical protein
MPAPSPPPKEQPKNPAENNAKNPSGIPVTIVETAEQAKAVQAREKEGRDYEAKDLDAQIRAADASERAATATEWQIIPTWLGAILSFVGTCLIGFTLYLTLRSNRIDRRSKIPHVFVENRPIIPKPKTTEKAKNLTFINLSFENHGNSVAVVDEIRWSIFFDELPVDFVSYQNRVKYGTAIRSQSVERIERKIWIEWTGERLAKIKITQGFWFVAVITYSYYFGHRFELGFCFRYDGSNPLLPKKTDGFAMQGESVFWYEQREIKKQW